MSKLIYSPTSALLESTYDGIKNRDQTVNPVYYSVAYTGDGYMYTHGKKFRLFSVINDEIEGLAFQIQNGTAILTIDGISMGSGTVIQGITGDSVITATTKDGTTSIGHTEYLNESKQYGSATQVPIITVNKSGHITAIQNSATIDISKVKAGAVSDSGSYYLTGVTGNTLQNPLYSSKLYFDEDGNLHANNLYIGNNAISTLYVPTSHTSVYATDSTYGHVILSDTPSSDHDVNDNIAATPKAVVEGINTANQYAQELFAAQDAMVFLGTIKANGVITSHNSTALPTVVDNTTSIDTLTYKVGWTFRFIEAGTFNGNDVEIGDMIIAVKSKGSQFNINDWTIIQTNISGALTATSNLNGLLYSNNSRVVNSLALASGVLKSDGSSLSFVNPNTLYRTIKVNSTSIGTNALNLISGNAISLTRNNGDVTIAVSASSIIGASSSLTLTQGDINFIYKPNADASLTIGDALTLTKDQNDNYILKHATGTTINNVLGSITTDSYGHVTSVTQVSSLPNPNALTIKTNSTSVLSYTGSAAKSLVFKNGGDISFTTSTSGSDNIISATVTHKYREIKYAANSSTTASQLLANNSATALTLIGGENVSITTVDSSNEALPAGTLMINALDTWRNIEAYKFQTALSRSSIGTAILKFGNDFIYSDDEVSIMWTEIDEQGRVTYVK